MQGRHSPRGTALAIHALAALALVSASVGAQPAPPAPPPPAVADPPAQAPTITVNDPLLAPVPPPVKVIASWKEALSIIHARSVDLAIATQDVQRSEGLARQALAAALPSINASGQLTHQLLFEPAAFTKAFITNPAMSAQLSASLPVLAPRAWYAAGTAYKSIDSSRMSVEDKHRTVLAGVANAIVAVFTAERVAEINRVNLKSALEQLDLTRRKFRLGDGTKLDVLRAEQSAATSRASLVTGDESLRQSREALGLALGFKDPYGVPPSIALNEIEQAVGSVCSAGALEQRADIRQAKNDLEVARRGITDAWLAFSPTAQISTTLNVANQTSSTSQSNATWSLQALISIPLWEGGARYGGLKIARASAEQSKIKLEATLRSASIEVAQALRAVAVAVQSRQVSEQSRDLAREAARLAQRAYEVGTGTSFDLVDTGQKQRSAELDLVVKEFQLIKARITALLAASICKY